MVLKDSHSADNGRGIVFQRPGDTEVVARIGRRFNLIDSERSAFLSPDNKNDLCFALTLFNRTVCSAKAHKDGRLELNFSANCVLKVNPDPRYEAWGLTAVTGFK